MVVMINPPENRHAGGPTHTRTLATKSAVLHTLVASVFTRFCALRSVPHHSFRLLRLSCDDSLIERCAILKYVTNGTINHLLGRADAGGAPAGHRLLAYRSCDSWRQPQLRHPAQCIPQLQP
jgi:hypothetical protein